MRTTCQFCTDEATQVLYANRETGHWETRQPLLVEPPPGGRLV